MPSADSVKEAETEPPAVDEARSALLEAVVADLGSAVVETHLDPGHDLWIRIANDSWVDAAEYFHTQQRFRFFDWLSAIDWKQSPFGRSMDAEVDKQVAASNEEADSSDTKGATNEFTETGADGLAGGETRFQVLARLGSLSTHLGVTLKADVDENLAIDTWTKVFPGASWHEREAYEMYGLTFNGHESLRNLYLPTDFEGHPLRKDFPLAARLVKPWPGIVDVEPMPEQPEKSQAKEAKSTPAGASTENPQDGGVQ